MTNSPSLELQEAVITRLRADSDITGIVSSRIYDYVPEETLFPYIEYKENSSSNNDAQDDLSTEHILTINVWSRSEGAKETWQILKYIKDSLHNYTGLVLSGHIVVNMRQTLQDLVREPDGQVYHGIIQFRCVTEE